MFERQFSMTSSKRTATPAKAEETRSRILGAALNCFRLRSFERTTMRDNATGAGVALGSAYYYFESNEALAKLFWISDRSAEPIRSRRLRDRKRIVDLLKTVEGENDV